MKSLVGGWSGMSGVWSGFGWDLVGVWSKSFWQLAKEFWEHSIGTQILRTPRLQPAGPQEMPANPDANCSNCGAEGKCVEIIRKLLESVFSGNVCMMFERFLAMFGIFWKSLQSMGFVWKFLEILENLWKLLEMFGFVGKPVVSLLNSGFADTHQSS